LVRSRASALIARAHGWGLAGFLTVVVTLSVLVAFAAWLVRRVAPYASGSGIPDVEAVLSERILPSPFWRLFPVKFVGGVLAIGSGLALGREGPSVQMGGNAANFVAELSRRNRSDSRALIAAGAGAGLAAAFNAPLAGVIFVLEELYKRFEISIALAALGASTTAIVVSRLILGDAPDYQVAPIAFVVDSVKPLFCLFGLLAGLLAVVYNIMLLGALSIADRLAHVPVELRAGLVGAAVGVLAWFAPAIVGGGDSITQSVLNGAGSLALLPLLYAIRLVLSTVSYATGTPGGLFAPMLVLGAQSGLFFGLLANAMFPSIGVQPESFAVVGMAALFTGIVRAPLTGIVLTMEMTANFTLLLPMLAACFVAMLIPTLLGNPPIYDSLRERALSRQDRDSPSDA
jgi:CIC family chloride channel protein